MTDGVHDIELPGCTPTPLAGYLKALAVLRLVAEQGGDPQVRGCWRDEVFVLRTRLSRDELLQFFLERYAPTPMVAPWGGRSGFYEGSSESSAREALNRLEGTESSRLGPFRNAIATVRRSLVRHGIGVKPSDDEKLALLRICRNELPDQLLPWLDTCYVLTSDTRGFPPLLGTGGNEGSGSYVSGYAQQVLACIIDRRHDDALGASLFAWPSRGAATDQTPGHFSPPVSAGPNATTGFEAASRLNPWDYVFTLEGALLFAGAATRRNEADLPTASFPFVTGPLASAAMGYSAVEEKPAQAKRQVLELWLPLWRQMLGIEEAAALMSEGRATLGKRTRTARNGLDFSRAIASLGVDRGIAQFQRFTFLMRNGQSFFAVPLERMNVGRRGGASLIDELEQRDWLALWQRHARADNAPAALRALGTRLDAALFTLTQRVDRQAVQCVLRLLGAIEQRCAVSAKSREALPPVPALSASWAAQADDSSAEFRIACALASLMLVTQGADGKPYRLGLRPHLVPVSPDGRAWQPESRLPVWGNGPIERNLVALLHRRGLEAQRLGAEGEMLAARVGATLDDVQRFLRRETDDIRIGELLGGLACVDRLPQPTVLAPAAGVAPPPGFAVLKPFFSAESLLRRLEWLPPDRSLRLPRELPARLAAGNADAALSLAWQRLRALGKRLPGRAPPGAAGVDGLRLLAALLIPLTSAETGRLLDWLDLPSDAANAYGAVTDTTTA